MRPGEATAAVRRLETFAGETTLLHGRGRRYEATSETGAFSLKMVRGGSACWRAGRRDIVLHESLFVFLPEGTRYTVTIESDRPVETACLFFPAALLPALAASGRLDDALEGRSGRCTEWPLQRCAADAAALDRLVRLVTGDLRLPGEQVEDILLSDLPRLFAAQTGKPGSWRLASTRAATRDELTTRVTTGRDFLLGHLDRPVALREAAAAAALSPFHFHRTFRAVFGVPPLRYVAERRLERAAFLLRHGCQPVTEVALACGFDSLSAFTRAFGRRFGAPPGRYRTRR